MTTFFKKLDASLTLNILKFLPKKELLSARRVSKELSALCSDDELWLPIAKRYFNTHYPGADSEKKLKRLQKECSIMNLYICSSYQQGIKRRNPEALSSELKQQNEYDDLMVVYGTLCPVGLYKGLRNIGEIINQTIFMRNENKRIFKLKKKFDSLKTIGNKRFQYSLEDVLLKSPDHNPASKSVTLLAK
jgi:F-box domain